MLDPLYDETMLDEDIGSDDIPQKRNTKLIHSNDHAGEDRPKLENMKEVALWSGLDDSGIACAMSIATKWLEENGGIEGSINTKAVRDFLNPLLDMLVVEMEAPLQAMDRGQQEHVLKSIIQRSRSNLKRSKTGSERLANSQLETSAPITPETKLNAPQLSSHQMNILPDYFVIATKDPRGEESFVNIRDIQRYSDTNHQQCSYDSWLACIREDLKVVKVTSVEFERGDKWQLIKLERHFTTALSWAVTTGQAFANFRINAQESIGRSGSRGKKRDPSPLFATLKRAKVAINREPFESDSKGTMPSDPTPSLTGTTLLPTIEKSNEAPLKALQGPECFSVVPPTPRDSSTDVMMIGSSIVRQEETTKWRKDESIKRGIPVRIGRSLADLNVDHSDPEFRSTASNEDGLLDDNNAERLMNRIPAKITEHFSEQRWQRCARLFLFDTNMHRPERIISVPGMISKLYPYQIFAVFLMLEMEALQGGGYLAEGMGLGKTIEILTLMSFCRRLNEAWLDVQNAWKKDDKTRHLPEYEDQTPDAICPSNNQFGIECPCVKSGVARQVQNQRGPTLLLLPPGLLPQWLAEFKKHMIVDDPVNKWVIRCAHTDAARASGIQPLTSDDFQYIDIKNFNKPHASRFICFTTSQSYHGQVENMVTTLNNARKAGTDQLQFAWTRVIVDEAHKESTSTTKGPKIAAKQDKASKWFLSGTPFEQRPNQMYCWLNTLHPSEWKTPLISKEYWGQQKERSEGWELASPAAMASLGKTHAKIVDGKIKDQNMMNEHLVKLRALLKTWWIKRDAEKSSFFGKILVELPYCIRETILCRLPRKYEKAINERVISIHGRLSTNHAVRIKKWKDNNCKGPEPQPVLSRWIALVRRTRILSSFPALMDCQETKDLEYSGSEDCENQWVVRNTVSPYRLSRVGSPYERQIRRITKAENCPKIVALEILMTTVWGRDDRVVIMTMGPTNALILYWYLRLVEKKAVAIINNRMKKPEITTICALFNGDPEARQLYPDEPPPQFLIGTTTLLGTGYNLTGGHIIVQFDPEWTQREQQQAIHRVWRIGQIREVLSYNFHTEGSLVEETIWNRQIRRQVWVELSQNSEIDYMTQSNNPDDAKEEDPQKSALPEHRDTADYV